MITIENILTLTPIFILLVLTINTYDFRHLNTGKPKKEKNNTPLPWKKQPILIHDYLNGDYYIQ